MQRWFRWTRQLAAGLSLSVLMVLIFGSVQNIPAQVLEPEIVWPAITLVQVPGAASTSPTQITHAGDGSNRLFIVEQDGRIRIYQNGAMLATPFLDINGQVRSAIDPGGGAEEGLLSVAFPPGYSQKDYFYVYYTRNDGNNRVSRFRLLNDNQADPSSEELILHFAHPDNTNHNGGQLMFGPDGYLYIGTGDGGSGGDPNNNAQNPNSLLGKLLRIDVEPHAPPDLTDTHKVYLPVMYRFSLASPTTYQIPADNPFVNQFGYRWEIWSLGLRNPWRFSFDRATGSLWIGDVGQGNWEEIDYQPPIAQGGGGENYGWRLMEGMHCFNPINCNPAGLTLPVWEYPNPPNTSNPPCASVTGGFVYRGSAYPSLQGIYLYVDYCSGVISGLVNEANVWNNHVFAEENHPWITSFGEDEAGELYVVDRNGSVFKITVP